MTTRRAFFATLAPIAAVAAFAPAVLPIIGGPPDVFGESIHGELGEALLLADAYQPYGHIKADDAMAFHVRAVLLDGEDITRSHPVIEADDRAGWALCLVLGEKVWLGDHYGPKTVRLTGEVRYVWIEEALT